MIVFDLNFCPQFFVFGLALYFCALFSKLIPVKFIMKNVDLGQMIQDEMHRQGRSVGWLAKEIYCEKSNVYKMFKRRSIDVVRLMKISEVLNHNFLRDCFDEVDGELEIK